MNKQIFFKWLIINGVSLVVPFIFIFFLVRLFPNIMLGLWGAWAALISMTGVKGAREFSPTLSTFAEIFIRNSISVSAIFCAGLLFVAPLVMILDGAYYSLVVFLAPMTGITFTLIDWILVIIEMLFVITSATFASTLATEIYQVKPELKGYLRWCKEQLTWKKFWSLPEQKRNWRFVFQENRKEFILFLLIILFLLLVGAAVEVWG